MSQHDQTQDDTSKYAGLSNKEIILVYYRMSKELKTMNYNLAKNIVTKQVETPMGMATAMANVPPEHVEKFKETEYFKTFNEVVEKLKPIVDIIVECDNDLKKIVEEFKY